MSIHFLTTSYFNCHICVKQCRLVNQLNEHNLLIIKYFVIRIFRYMICFFIIFYDIYFVHRKILMRFASLFIQIVKHFSIIENNDPLRTKNFDYKFFLNLICRNIIWVSILFTGSIIVTIMCVLKLLIS